MMFSGRGPCLPAYPGPPECARRAAAEISTVAAGAEVEADAGAEVEADAGAEVEAGAGAEMRGAAGAIRVGVFPETITLIMSS